MKSEVVTVQVGQCLSTSEPSLPATPKKMREEDRTDPVPLAYDSCTISTTEKHHEPPVQKVSPSALL